MSDISELVPKINAAEAAITKLPGGKGSRELKLKILRSLYPSIKQARLRGVTYQSLAKSISETTGLKMTAVSLKKYLDALNADAEETARKISKTISDKATS